MKMNQIGLSIHMLVAQSCGEPGLEVAGELPSVSG
jgi:hypothetical protein